MKKLIAALNKKEIYHTVTAKGVELMPADLSANGKAQLKKYFGFEDGDFTVPKQLKDPFVNKASELIKQETQKAK